MCGFWDRQLNEGQGDWSMDGCTFVEYTSQHVLCQCDHLTAFTVLLLNSSNTTTPSLSPPPDMESLETPRLLIVSCVGIAVCMGFLVGTVISILMFSNVRRRSSSVFHCQLSVAVFCLLAVLIVGVNSTSNVTGCVIVGVLLHYFLLTTWAFFAAEASHLFIKTYLWFNKSSYKYLTVVSFLSWGLPVVVVVVTLALSSSTYINEDDGYCFIDSLYVFLGTVVAPVFLILVVNIFIYALMLIKYKTENLNQRKFEYLKKNAVKDTIAITGLMTLFLLSGSVLVLHFTGVIEQLAIQVAFGSLCIIFGGYMFCSFVLASKEIRKKWSLVFKSCNRLFTRKTYGYDLKHLQRLSHDELEMASQTNREASTVTMLSANSLSVEGEVHFNEEAIDIDDDNDDPASRYVVPDLVRNNQDLSSTEHSPSAAATPYDESGENYYIEVVGGVKGSPQYMSPPDEFQTSSRECMLQSVSDEVVLSVPAPSSSGRKSPAISIQSINITVLKNRYSDNISESDDEGDFKAM